MRIASKIKIIGPRQIIRTMLAINKHGFTLLALLGSVKNKRGAFIQDDSEKISYDGLYSQSLAMAYYLNSRYTIDGKSKVAIISANSISFIKSLFAASGLGADIFLLNPHQKKGYFAGFFSTQKIDLIICDTTIRNELSSFGIPVLCYDDIHNIQGRPDHGSVKRKKGNVVILSSGSKGTPEIEKRKVSVIRYLNPLVAIIEKLHLKRTQSVLISVPVFHGYGLAAVLLSIFMGKKIRLNKKFDTEKMATILKEEQPDCWIAVPLMIQKVYALPNVQLRSLQSIISGGDVFPPAIIEAIHKTTAIKLYNLYGTSETGVCTIATDDDLKKYPNTIGKAITGIRTRIGETGQLSVKCAWSSDSRHNGYIATGDLVSKNEEGYFFYKGRQDDMMVIGGENVYPAELENIIYKNADIRWVKAKSVIHENQMAQIHVDLVINPEAAFSQEGFLNWLSGEVPNYMIPRSVTLLDEVPIVKLMQ